MDKRTIAVALVLCAGLVGCTTTRVAPTQTVTLGGRNVTIADLPVSALARPRPDNVFVFVVNGALVIDQEPVRPTSSQYDPGVQRYRIRWILDADSTNGYTFPSDDAITFAAGAPPRLCTRILQNKAIVCEYPAPQSSQPKQWKYQVTVTGFGQTPTLDPMIVND